MNGEYEKLTKKEVRKAWFNWFRYFLCVFGFERLEAPGMIMTQMPIIEKYYKNDKEGRRRLLDRHKVFFNVEPTWGSMLIGLILKMEESIANGRKISDEFIQNLKVGLMGPLSGFGDSMNQAIVAPIILSIAIGLSAGGSFAGPLFALLIPVYYVVISYTFFHLGYNLGESAVEKFFEGKMALIQEALSVMGLVVTGAITASYVRMNLALEFTSAETTVKVQEVLDGFFPNLLSIGLVLLGYWLLTRKKFNAIKLILIVLVIATVGVVTGIL